MNGCGCNKGFNAPTNMSSNTCNNNSQTYMRRAPSCSNVSFVPSIDSANKDMEKCGVVFGTNHPEYHPSLQGSEGCSFTFNNCGSDNSTSMFDPNNVNPLISNTQSSEGSGTPDIVGTTAVVDNLVVRNMQLVRGQLVDPNVSRRSLNQNSTPSQTGPLICVANRCFNGPDGCPICIDDVYIQPNNATLTGLIVASFHIGHHNGSLAGLRSLYHSPTLRNITNEPAHLAVYIVLLRYNCCGDCCPKFNRCDRSGPKYKGHPLIVNRHIYTIQPGSFDTLHVGYGQQPQDSEFVAPSDTEFTSVLFFIDGDVHAVELVSVTVNNGIQQDLGTFRTGS